VLFIAAVVALVAIGGVALWMLRPGSISGRTPERVHAERAAAEAEEARRVAERLAASCKATLTVTDVPADAEVLLRIGGAPVDVERMPIGARLEFVALMTGHVPRRAVVPAGAVWEPGPDGKPRFEVAVQLDPLPKGTPKGAAEPWPPAEPGSEVGGRGAPGTVHVVSTPRGAEIWLLAGIGPEAQIDQLRCNEDVTVLVAGAHTPRKRLRVEAAQFKLDPNPNAQIRAATVSAR
jgi:hypothetical protein